MTQTNTPKPGPRPDRRPTISQGSVVDVAAEPLAGPGRVPPAGAADAAVTGDVAPAGDISVVTVSDAQDRTSAGSLPAVGGVVQQGTVTSAMPVVTAGPGVAASDIDEPGTSKAPVAGAEPAGATYADAAAELAPNPSPPLKRRRTLPGAVNGPRDRSPLPP